MKCYTYKINFVDGYYYIGKRILKDIDSLTDGYYGTPITHKEKWNTTMYYKEIIREYDDWIECSKDEIELIKPVLNEEFCLNMNCGGYCSMEILKENGRRVGTIQPLEVKKSNGCKSRDQKLGLFAMSKEERQKVSREAGRIAVQKKSGIHSQTREDRVKLGEYCRKNKLGFHSWTKEDYINHNKRMKEQGKGVYGRTKERKSEIAKKSAATRNKKKWKCTITGHISNVTGLAKFQKNRGIDPSNRICIDNGDEN